MQSQRSSRGVFAAIARAARRILFLVFVLMLAALPVPLAQVLRVLLEPRRRAVPTQVHKKEEQR